MKHVRSTSGRPESRKWPSDKQSLRDQQATRAPAATAPAVSERGAETAEAKTVVVTKFSILGARVVWFFVGPIAAFLTLWAMLTSGSAVFSVHDALFFCLVTLIVGCRWFEQRSGQASNLEGKPATWKEFRRYAVRFPIVAVTAWLMTKVVLMLL